MSTPRDRWTARTSRGERGGYRVQATPERGTTSGRIPEAFRNGRGPGQRAPRARGGRSGILVLLGFAAIVLLVLVTIVGPALGGFARGLAQSNPDSLRLPFMPDLVRAQLGSALTDPAGTDDTPIRFEVPAEAGISEVADDLVAQKLIRERLVFQYLMITQNATDKLQAGTFTLRRTMTPQQIADRLQKPPDPVEQKIALGIREGLRLEQVVALLAAKGPKGVDVDEFRRLAEDPPDELKEDFEFLEVLPEGASLEGFIPSGTYSLAPSITAPELIRRFLAEWEERIGPRPIERAKQQGRDFYEVLTLASIVEREATLPQERRTIAGVYQNRLDELDPPLLNADPTVFYAYDTGRLREMTTQEWAKYAFWVPPKIPLGEIDVPEDLERYQTYRNTGLPPGPICTPSRGSIDAALDPDTESGYFYFVAKNDGSKAHAFAKTAAEHRRNVRRFQGGG